MRFRFFTQPILQKCEAFVWSGTEHTPKDPDNEHPPTYYIDTNCALHKDLKNRKPKRMDQGKIKKDFWLISGNKEECMNDYLKTGKFRGWNTSV